MIAVNPSSGPVWTTDPTDELRDGLPGAQIGCSATTTTSPRSSATGSPVAVGAAGGDGTLSAGGGGRPRSATSCSSPCRLERSTTSPATSVSTTSPTPSTPCGRARRCAWTSASSRSPAAHAHVRQHVVLRGLHADRRRPRATPAAARQVAGAARGTRPRAAADGAAGARARRRPTEVWLGWIGNCAYAPDGFGPSWRERLDDGRLDVRLVLGRPTVRARRLVVDVLVGRLQRCPVYREQLVESLKVRSLADRCGWPSTARRSTAERPSTSRSAARRCSWPSRHERRRRARSDRPIELLVPERAEALLVRSDLVEVDVVDAGVDHLLRLSSSDRPASGPHGTDSATISGVTTEPPARTAPASTGPG